jgi:hypothetical protein
MGDGFVVHDPYPKWTPLGRTARNTSAPERLLYPLSYGDAEGAPGADRRVTDPR